MTPSIRTMLAGAFALAASLFAGTPAASTLTVVENQATMSPFWETTPTLGNDGNGDLVVYTSRELLNTGLYDQGDIYYQRLVAGQPVGSPVQVTRSLTEDQLNDISGENIVFTAYDAIDAFSGSIMLFRISNNQLFSLGNSAFIHEPRIFGNNVVWRQGAADSAEVILYNLNTNTSDPIGGPSPAAFDVDVGDKWVVWSSRETTTSDYDLEVFNLATREHLTITNTATIDERNPATSGDWIVWSESDVLSRSGRILALNTSTWEVRIIVDDGATNRLPSIDGDLIAWEGNPNGDFDVFVYRISTEETFVVTFDQGDQYLNDVNGNLVAYVDMRSGNEDIYTAKLLFEDPDPCAAAGGDTDQDGVCDDNDNCPLTANADQADSNNNGIGDACEIIACSMPSVAPGTLNFGEVTIGESSTQIVTFTNTDSVRDLRLEAISFTAGSSADFEITAAPTLPADIGPGATADVSVSFRPTVEAVEGAQLYIGWLCSANNMGAGIGMPVSGTGLRAPVPPEQQVSDILSFMDAAILGGTLTGSGPGNSASGRLGALHNMIEAAGSMIKNGQYAEACDQLRDALNRTDGAPKPPDFVTGTDAANLAAAIQALRADLGCR